MNRDPFAAIADPTRRAIIDLLTNKVLNINQISDYFNQVSRQGITKHIKYLEESGLINIEKDGREKYCFLVLDNLVEVYEWLQQHEKFWNKKLDSLGEYLDKENKNFH